MNLKNEELSQRFIIMAKEESGSTLNGYTVS